MSQHGRPRPESWPPWARPYASPVPRAVLAGIALGVAGLGAALLAVDDVLFIERQPANDLRDLLIAAGVLASLGGTLAAIATVPVWAHRAYRNLPALGGSGLRSSPAGAAGWWFVPVANLWKPFSVVRETWWACCPASAGEGVLWLWWVLLLISQYIGGRQRFLAGRGVRSGDLDLALDLMNAWAAVLAVLIVRRITRWQTAKAATPPALPPGAMTAPPVPPAGATPEAPGFPRPQMRPGATPPPRPTPMDGLMRPARRDSGETEREEPP